MGLLEKLGIGGTPQQREARTVARLLKKVLEKFGPPENRQGALEELGALHSEAAVEALLQRFTIRVDPGITDDEEKQRVHALVIEAGAQAAVPALRRFILGRDEVSWPLRALADLVPESEVVAVLLEALGKAAEEYSRVPEKKVLLLRALALHRNPGAAAAALPFLEDMDDEVQIAAAHAIAAQAQQAIDGEAPEAGRAPLIEAFLRAHEHSNARVKEALASVLAESRWDVKGYTPKVEAALPAGYKLDARARVVHRT